MRRFYQLIYIPWIQVILFLIGICSVSLLAIQPFTLNQMPETADGLLHLYRVGAVDYSLRVDNPLWVRYSTGIVYGYGAPLFNYFPPLSYYVGSWFHVLGMSFVQSWLMMVIFYTLSSAIGMFLLGRIWTQSNIGGWVSAIAMIYAPYFLFDSVARGTSSELGALAVLPFAFYGFTRLSIYGRRIDFVFAIVAYALFIPMHTIITLHGTLLLGVYCLFLWLTSDDKLHTFLRLLFAGGLALMMTAFFWIPAIVETDAVKINLIAENLEQIDVTRHLRPLGDLLALPHTADPTQMAQPIPITLSIVQLILSVFGLIISWNDRNPIYRNLLLVLWCILLVLTFLNTPYSVGIWDNVPLIGYTQFPWRLLSLASLVLALMTGISVWLAWVIIPAGWIKNSVFGVLVLLIVAYGIPWTYSLYLDNIQLEDIRDVHQFERETGQLTLSSYSEYLPVSTDESQLDANRLIERFAQADVIPRLLESDELEILSQEWTATSGTLQIRSLAQQIIIFDWLYVEGWTAQLAGIAIDVFPSNPAGLVAVNVPAGEFDLQIALQPTSTQSLSVVISLWGIVIAVIVSIFWRYLRGISNLHGLQIDPEIMIYGIVVTVGIGVFLFKAVILDWNNTQFKSTRFGNLSSENHDIKPLANFDNQIDLLDYEFVQNGISSHLVTIKLYWRLHDKLIDADYSSIIRMRNSQGIVIAEASSFQPGGLDTSNWFVDKYIIDAIEIEIPPFTPPLNYIPYTLEIGLFNRDSLEQLSVINADGRPVDFKYELKGFDRSQFRSAYSSTRIRNIDVQNNSDLDFGLYVPAGLPDLPASVTAGDEIEIDFTWQKVRHISTTFQSDYFAQLIWLDQTANRAVPSKIVPLVMDYPTHLWYQGEVVAGHHRLIVPADIPAGEYQMGIQLVDEGGESVGEIIMLNKTMNIAEPDRLLERPTMQTDVNIVWDNHIMLDGYRLSDSGEVQLFWRTKQVMQESFRLFVQVLDDSDGIVALVDEIPVNWTRPTTGWITDEYVITSHPFDIPAGAYRIRLGWYDPLTDQRVTIQNSDSIILDDRLIIE